MPAAAGNLVSFGRRGCFNTVGRERPRPKDIGFTVGSFYRDPEFAVRKIERNQRNGRRSTVGYPHQRQVRVQTVSPGIAVRVQAGDNRVVVGDDPRSDSQPVGILAGQHTSAGAFLKQVGQKGGRETQRFGWSHSDHGQCNAVALSQRIPEFQQFIRGLDSLSNRVGRIKRKPRYIGSRRRIRVHLHLTGNICDEPIARLPPFQVPRIAIFLENIKRGSLPRPFDWQSGWCQDVGQKVAGRPYLISGFIAQHLA